MNIRMIAAASLNGVIGFNNKLPWDNDYPEDIAFFRKMTAGSTVIMGRRTYESIGRPLPKRRNIVLSHRMIPKMDIPGVETFHSLTGALESCEGDVWIIGGSFVYQEGLQFADSIYLTTIPKLIKGDGLVYFPFVNPDAFNLSERITISEGKNLYCNVFKAKSSNS